MSKVQMLRAVVDQRLTAAAEEIFVLFERSIAEYEEELSRSKEENERQRKLLDAVFNPQLQLHRADVQQLLESKEEVPPEQQQEWSSSLDQEDPEPPHIKEEEEELWTSQEGEQLQGLEEADITTFTLILVPVKSEDDEEKPQSSQLHQRQTEQMETEADGEDCGGSEPDPDKHLQPVSDDKTSDTPETDVIDDRTESRKHRSRLNTLKNNEDPLSDVTHNAAEGSFSCSECGQRFGRKPHLNTQMRIYTGEKPFSCSFCGKTFSQKGNSTSHTRLHTGEKPFSCTVCKKTFRYNSDVRRHMRTHTGEKPFNSNMALRRRFDVKFKERVLQYAEEHSGEKAAKHFDIDSKRIRYWKKQKNELLLADKRRARLAGGGRKTSSLELERRLSAWIYSMQDEQIQISKEMIKNKALEIYSSVSDGGKMFMASRGWLQKFLQRHNLSL
ncbi:zinc finger protein 510-like isoform X2 [Thunnus maccoyii]|uniref:zinc finger protein 510-like isoform X2 n=1 Tax=Thunnus maccoyii TaxID=8240 RepID=UPI001C4B1BFA|nr:zinc finger protein 510-like isoform X2 [Thunnus maccoyii]